MNAVGTEWITPGLPRMTHECSGYGMDHAWVTEDDSVEPDEMTGVIPTEIAKQQSSMAT